jgi:2-phospho-L-lactate guanylyltransferase
MRTAAILPVKRFSQAKQRLGRSVADPVRLALARAMVADVLLALSEVTAIERTIVVTSEPTVPAVAAEHGAHAIGDGGLAGQSAAVALGVGQALADGFDRALCVPGDCPALDAAELETLLGEADRRRGDAGTPEVVIIPDRHGAGTNGLLLTPPDAIAPSFGPDSCERHRQLAGTAGLHVVIARPSSLLLDIDTGEDLAALRERLATAVRGAPRTRALLAPNADVLAPIATAR